MGVHFVACAVWLLLPGAVRADAAAASDAARDLRVRSGQASTRDAHPPRGTSVATKLALHQEDDGLTVVIPLVSFQQKIHDLTTLSAEWDADVLTAASVDVRTAASKRFQETRHALTLGADHTFRHTPATVSGSVNLSRERDYESVTASIGGSHDFLQRNLTVSGGYAYVFNRVGRSGTRYVDFSRRLDIHALNLGLSQILSRRTLLIVSGSLILARGYQASVYRFVPVFATGAISRDALSEQSLVDGTVHPLYRLPEAVPDDRLRAAALLRINHYFPTHTALSASYRFYADSWALRSHTLAIKLYQDLPHGLLLRVRGRFYLQNGAAFYRALYETDDPETPPRYLTMDRELSPFTYDLFGLKLTWDLGRHGPFTSVVLDAKVDVQWTRYADFPYLDRRRALIVETGLAFDL